MTDKVSIVNQAIGLLNGNRIVASTDGTTEANLASDSYEELRDAVLEEADWSFAIIRLQIAKDATAPLFDWTGRYLIPDETLRVLSVNGNKTGRAWVREGQYILTNFGVCEARVLSKVTNPNYFSKMFLQALVYRIAWTWAIPLTKSTKIREQYKADYIDLITEATTVDGMQGTPEKTGQGRLVEARYEYPGNIAGPFV